MQARLQEERAKRAEVDKREAEALALGINGKEMTILVKVDQEGHMYGSVSALDIVHLFEKEGIKLERRNVVLPHPLKELGTFKINLRLKEGVPATIVLKVESETPLPQKEQKIEKPAE
jgi:large subunit ribosomal protein L9